MVMVIPVDGAKQFPVFVPSLGDFFSIFPTKAGNMTTTVVFSSPLSGTFFQFIGIDERFPTKAGNVFVPSLGDFFSIACLRSPSPSALASAFAAGMDQSLHQALSFGDEMPISPVRAGIGGDGNEK